MNQYTKVLTIAGSDSGGGAGIQADIKTISSLGVYACTAITAITAQNTLGVRSVEMVSSQMLTSQIEAVMEDIGADAVKIGMVGSGENIRVIARSLEPYVSKGLPVVLDPVLVATSGDSLAGEGVKSAMIEHLFPLCALLTPNLPEAEVLCGERKDIETMGRELQGMGARSVLIKGGHNPQQGRVHDVLFSEGEPLSFNAPFFDTPNKHGTGCSLSAAIATFLAAGMELHDAVERAIFYVGEAIEAGASWKLGEGHGPIRHFYKLWK